MKNNFYKDRYCADGIISDGWRYVKKGGRVKIGGKYYHDPRLEEIVEEYVHVQINCYWMSEVIIFRGAIGCTRFYCLAK